MKEYPLFVGKNCDAFSNFVSDYKEFSGMKDGRIPSILTLTKGSFKGRIIAAADKASCGADWGFIEIGVRISDDCGKSFSDIKSVFTPPVRKYPYNPEEFSSAFAIDPLLMETDDGKVIMLVDFYPECKGLHARKLVEKGSGYTCESGENALKLYTGKSKLDGMFTLRGKQFTLQNDGYIYDSNGKKTSYYIPHNHSAEYGYSTLGDVYYCIGEKPQYIDAFPPLMPDNAEGNDIYVGNIFLSKGKKVFKGGDFVPVSKKAIYNDDGTLLCVETEPAPFRAPVLSYIYMMISDDGGETFAQPVDVTHYYKKETDGIFVGVGPGIGITLKHGENKGRILAPCYKLNEALVLISDDNGKSWHRNQGQFCENIDECQLVEMPDGKIFCFGRPKGGGNIPLSVSDDAGETFRRLESIPPRVPQCQRSVISLPPDFILPDKMENDGRFILLSTPTGHSGKDSTRTEGKVFLGRIDGEKVSWLKEYPIKDNNKYSSFGKYSDFYAYSCLSVIDNMTIGLLYEAYPSGFMSFVKFSL